MVANDDRAVFLHVGLPKSGTTYLQDCLWEHRGELLERGLSYPGPRPITHFRAAVDLRGSGRRWGMDPEKLTGTWDWLAGLARDAPGAVVISHEVLASCQPAQVRRAVASFGDREVHVVATARDLGRQVVAHWQEMVKNGSTVPFHEFAAKVVRTAQASERSTPFWLAQDLGGVLDRWAAAVPVERIHVLPVDSSGADPDALWHTFGDVVGVDTTTLPPPARGANASLGRGEVGLLRAVNGALDGRIPQPAYRFVVKQWFAQKLLPGHDPARLGLTPELHAALTGVAQELLERVRSGGFAVHGDLHHLMPRAPTDLSASQDDLDAEDAYHLSVGVLAEVLEEVARLRESNASLRRQARSGRGAEASPRPETDPPAPGARWLPRLRRRDR